MQGYWVCAIVAALSWITLSIAGHSIVGFFFFLFFYLSGAGVREHSPYAAVLVFVMFAFGTATSPSIVEVFFVALLLSNLRATWIASRWKPDSTEATMPVRLAETWGDKFVDKLPQWLWPKVRIPYYVLSVCLFLMAASGTAVMILRRRP